MHKTETFGAKTRSTGQPLPAWNYESKKRKTRREIFLERMNSLIPWEPLEERHFGYAKVRCRGLTNLITAERYLVA